MTRRMHKDETRVYVDEKLSPDKVLWRIILCFIERFSSL